MWESKLSSIEPIDLSKPLSRYAIAAVFRHLDKFRLEFWSLSILSVVSNSLKFGTTFLISYIVSNISEITSGHIWGVIFPLIVGCVAVCGILDFFTRKYAEALPAVFTDLFRLRFYKAILQAPPGRVATVSKEKLLIQIDRYIAHVQSFLADWFWSTLWKITRFVIILCILGYQSIAVLCANLAYVICFLGVSFAISARYSTYATRYATSRTEAGATFQNFFLNHNTVRRLFLREYALMTSVGVIKSAWRDLEAVRSFHAKRWLFQLSIFDTLYLGTLGYGIYQVQAGTQPLGMLLLLKWAFDELWGILVYAIEYYVSIVQQRADADLLRSTVASLHIDKGAGERLPSTALPWRAVRLVKASAKFEREDSSLVVVSVPSLVLNRGDKVGIVGPSGAGKSTILGMILKAIPFEGTYEVDGVSMQNLHLVRNDVAVVAPCDVLFRLSLRDNILLGEHIEDSRFERILEGVGVTEFCKDLSMRIGDPGVHLSTGQEQRIRLARGLVQDSAVLLLDEPFTGLDDAMRKKVRAFIGDYCKGRTVVLVTHDEDDLDWVERVYEMREGVLRPRRDALSI